MSEKEVFAPDEQVRSVVIQFIDQDSQELVGRVIGELGLPIPEVGEYIQFDETDVAEDRLKGSQTLGRYMVKERQYIYDELEDISDETGSQVVNWISIFVEESDESDVA